MIRLLIIFLITATTFAVATDIKTEKSFPKWHAIIKYNSEDGFQLRDEAVQFMGIKFLPLHGNPPWKIPESALVRVKYSTGVYRKYQDWISFVLVEVISSSASESLVRSRDLEKGDQIAITGGSELRLTERDLTNDAQDTCSH